MKQILIQSGKTVIADVPVPLVGKGHVLVEVAYSLISTGTEISVLESSGKSLLKRSFGASSQLDKVLEYLKHQGVHKTVSKIRDRLQEAIPVGYSCSGVVIQVGEGVEGFQPGDKVACAGAGLANHAEIVLIPRNLVAKVPTNCSLKAAASATLGAIAMQGVRRADLSLGEFVAVIGLGLLGQLSVQLLKANGCQVIGIDLDPRRVGVALSLGADYAFIAEEVDITNEIFNVTGGYGVDATIIAASSKSSKTVQNAMD